MKKTQICEKNLLVFSKYLFSTFIIALSALASSAVSSENVKEAAHKARQPHIEVELIAEQPTLSSKPRVGVMFKPDPGWHIYWRNPGDTGLAPTIQWQGLDVKSELSWPYPEYIPIAHLVNLGYHYETLLWSDYDTRTANGEILAQVDWLVCKEACIPGSAELKLSIADLGEVQHERASKLFDQWQEKIPEAFEVMDARAAINEDALSITVYADKPIFNEQDQVEVFIENLDLVVYGQPVRQRAVHNVLMWEQKLSEFKSSDPQIVRAVVVINQEQAFSLAIPLQET